VISDNMTLFIPSFIFSTIVQLLDSLLSDKSTLEQYEDPLLLQHPLIQLSHLVTHQIIDSITS
jgi:hypothetical protein